MTTIDDQKFKDQLDNLIAHLKMAKSLEEDQKEEQFCTLLEKAQKILGDLSPHIAIFYYQYASFLLGKIQKNMDLFNPEAVPNAQEEDFIDEYDECYEDDEWENGANNDDREKKEVTHHEEEKKQRVNENDVEKIEKPSNDKIYEKLNEKVLYQDECVQITEIDEKLKDKMADNPDLKQNDNEEEELSDIEVCYENFSAALNIYNRELQKIKNGEQSPLDQKTAFKYKFHIHSRLGELYLFDQKYEDSISEFRTVIELASSYDHPETRRLISEAHFNIANALLHQNNAGCEELAIKEYIIAVTNLLEYLKENERYDTSKFQVPTLEKPKVDRYQYLRAPQDHDLVAELKEAISMVLDKIEDTHEQIGVRTAYEAEKKKMEKEKQESGFKEVPKDVKVTNLGTFGNRKRTPTQNPETPNQIASILSGLNPNAPSEQMRNLTVESLKQQNSASKNQETASKDETKNETGVKDLTKIQNDILKVNSDTKDSKTAEKPLVE